MLDPVLAGRLRSWMFEDALPFWASAGFDRTHGGPLESLALDASGDAGEGFKRVRAVARQVYVFAHAATLGWEPGRAASDSAFAWMLSHCQADVRGGWWKTVTPAGDPLDRTADLYDHAFALFALGWRVKAFNDPVALEFAHATLDRIEAGFAHPGGLGFEHVLPPGLPRQQNPHMHLTEACLVLDSCGYARFGLMADRIVSLFSSKLADPATGILPEFFTADWVAMDGDAGRIVEPGHQFEWAWILARHQIQRGADNLPLVRALVTWAERHGVDPVTGATRNQVWRDGSIKDGGSRTWPNTERVKGWIGLHLLEPTTGLAPAEAALELLLSRYLAPAPRGCWIDAFDGEGRAVARTIPASTFYHVFLAFAEALEVAG